MRYKILNFPFLLSFFLGIFLFTNAFALSNPFKFDDAKNKVTNSPDLFALVFVQFTGVVLDDEPLYINQGNKALDVGKKCFEIIQLAAYKVNGTPNELPSDKICLPGANGHTVIEILPRMNFISAGKKAIILANKNTHISLGLYRGFAELDCPGNALCTCTSHDALIPPDSELCPTTFSICPEYQTCGDCPPH